MRTERRKEIATLKTPYIEFDIVAILLATFSICLFAGGLLSSDQTYVNYSMFYLMFTIAGISLASLIGINVDRTLDRRELMMVLEYGIIGSMLIVIVQTAIFRTGMMGNIATLQIMGVIGGACAEELFFRGGLYNIQTAVYGEKFMFWTLISNNIVFTAFHFAKMKVLFNSINWIYLSAIFVSGIIITMAGVLSKKLSACMMTHMIFNILATMMGGE
jgi:membrane protease YdiL (CAAX protease family)